MIVAWRTGGWYGQRSAKGVGEDIELRDWLINMSWCPYVIDQENTNQLTQLSTVEKLGTLFLLCVTNWYRGTEGGYSEPREIVARSQ